MPVIKTGRAPKVATIVTKIIKEYTSMSEKTKTKPSTHYSSDTARPVPGILINRDPPITAGWCGNDNCEHVNHKQMRAAQAAADKRAKH